MDFKCAVVFPSFLFMLLPVISGFYLHSSEETDREAFVKFVEKQAILDNILRRQFGEPQAREADDTGECGMPAIAPKTFGRIWGGAVARPHSWPWMVSLQANGWHECGGMLINNQWILTAAHCEPNNEYRRSNYRVVIGAHNIETDDAIVTEVDRIIPHENYRLDRHAINHEDLMLLKLPQPVTFNANISTVCLPEPGEEFAAGTRCYTSGWGLTDEWRFPDVLHQVMVPLISKDMCNQGDWYNDKITDVMQCAGFPIGQRDSCSGDSGGPLVCNQDGRWVLVGITSWGDDCGAARKPGVYTKVSKFVTWINEQISASS